MVLFLNNLTANDEPRGRLRLVFRGGPADAGNLLLDEYAASLAGWLQFFRISADLVLRSHPDTRHLRPDQLLRIEIRGERRGSYEAIFEFLLYAGAAGIVGNAAYEAARWSFKRFVAWSTALANSHLQRKRETTNIDELVTALEEMTEEVGVNLAESPAAEAAPKLFDSAELIGDEDSASPVDRFSATNRKRAVAEAIDHALREATEPLDASCENIELSEENGSSLINVTANDRLFIVAPVTLPPPVGEWQQHKVKFVRINRKTGRALFYFDNDPRGESNTHYCRIIDPAVSSPGNVYTQAFNDDHAILVFIRQVRAERGRINLMWDISVHPPDDRPLFERGHQR